MGDRPIVERASAPASASAAAPHSVTPAKAGVFPWRASGPNREMPAFAGMTVEGWMTSRVRMMEATA